MKTESYTPRFSFEISDEQQQRATRLLSTYGIRKAIFARILDDVLDIIEQHGGMAIGIMMGPAVKPRDIIPTMKEIDNYEKKE